MSYIRKTVNTYGTEIDFLKHFAEELTSADSRIVCESDIDSEMVLDSSKKARIKFNINGVCNIEIERSSINTSPSNNYRFYLTADGITYTTSGNISCDTTSRSITDISTRTLNFLVISNDTAIYIAFGSYSTLVPPNENFAAMILKNDNFSGIAGTISSSNNIMSQLFYYCDTEHKGNTFKFINRIEYEAESGIIELINSKVMANSTVNKKIMDFKGLVDCSSISPKILINIDNDRYYSINSNTLIKISEE